MQMGKAGKMAGTMKLSSTPATARVTDAGKAYSPGGKAASNVTPMAAPVAAPVAVPVAPEPASAQPETTTPAGQARAGVPVPASQVTAKPTSSATAPTIPIPVGNLWINFTYQQHGEYTPVRNADGTYRAPNPPPGQTCLPPAVPYSSDKVICYSLECTDARRGAKMELLDFTIAVNNTRVPVKHWADFQAAQAWAEQAARLLNQTSRIQYLDSATPGMSDDQRRALYEQQVRFVYEVFEAIANVYNELNIPWSIDPDARQLFRKFLAGFGGLGSEFVKGADYNGGSWYSKEQIDPRVSNYPFIRNAVGPTQGVFVRRARRFGVLEDPAQNPIHFRQLAGIRMEGPDSDPENPLRSPYVFAQQAINKPFAIPNGLGSGSFWNKAWLPKTTNYVMNESLAGWAPNLPANQRSQFNNIGAGWTEIGRLERARDALSNSRMTNGSFQDDQFSNDWRTYGKSGYVNTTGIQQVAIPLRDYLDWAREWVAAINARPMATILRQSREFVLARNLGWVQSFGGSAGFIDSLNHQQAGIADELKGSGNTTAVVVGGVTSGLVRSIGAVIPAIGPAFAGMIGGAIDTIASVFGALLSTGSVQTFGRDDLGTFKPVFERAFLAGTIDATGPLGANHPPAVPPPPWFCRNETLSAQNEISASNPPPVIPPPPPVSGKVAIAKTAAFTALTGGFVAGGIAVLRRIFP